MKAGRWSFAFVAAVLVAGAPETGSAQGRGSDGSRDLLTPFGEYVLLGGGVTNFTDDAVKDRFDVGGTWDVRLGFGSRYFVGGEVAYVGSALNADGAGSDLIGHGAEAVLRLQYPYETGSWLIEPFAFGGIGWSRLSLRDAPPGVLEDDDVGVVPFGAGVTLGYQGFLVDARFTYRARFDEDLALAANEGPADLQGWAVGASIGYEF